MSHPLSIVILAAGKGSRMRSDTPKVLHTLCSRPMLYYSIREACAITDDVTVVVAHQKERVIAMIEEHFEGVRCVVQDATRYPGTGGALRDITPRYERVLILNGDMPLIQRHDIERFLLPKEAVVMSILRLDDPSGYGRVLIHAGHVERIVEHKDATPQELQIHTVNAGVYAFERAVLERYIPRLSNANAQGEYYLTDVIAMAHADALPIAPLEVEEIAFRGVNSKADLASAEEIMLDRLRRGWMERGVIMQLPQSIYIDDAVTFEGECILENGVRICGASHIIASHIKAHSVIESSTISHSDIGPLAHIRPQSQITQTHIGNFVEVKKSTLTGVKAGHLSYLGDATIDEGTNIGAGTITCNYDGKKKYTTTIGKNVFVGSDSQLVAPITIADDVMIAAGTTLTSGHYESDALLLSRTPVRVIKGFFTKFFGTRA